ncbi:MAG: phosphoribosylglycinamide formyltransferase [Rickettsiales bacterium]
MGHSAPKRARTAVLISGSGSNLQALIDAASVVDYPAEIALVISNKAEAFGLTRAQKADIPTETLSHKDFASREAFDDALHALLQKHNIELVCLAGFMRLLTADFVTKWHGRMINIHPSLLPLYKGLHTHKRALEDGVRFSGCTVHFVVPDMDSGPIILQAAVPILQHDTEETLQHRVHAAEHQIYPRALRWLASGQLKVTGNKVAVLGVEDHASFLVNPA